MMKLKFPVLLATCALAIGAMGSAHAADVVNLKSGESAVQGTISAVSQTSVTVDRRIGEPVTVPANNIRSIIWDGEPPVLNLARSHEFAGRFDRALQTYQEVSQELSSDNENLKADLKFVIARATAKQALTDPERVAEAVKLLNDFLLQNSDNYNYYDAVNLLGQVHLSTEDYDQAQAKFEQLAKAPWTDYQMAAQTARGRLMLAQDNLLGAQTAFEEVLKSDAKSPAELARRYEAMLGKAACLTRQQQFDEAVAVLNEVVQQVPPEETQIQAEAYVRQGDSLAALGRNKEAVLAYLHVDVLFPGEAALRAESLYHLSRLWGAVGYPDRASAARESLVADYPNSEWTKKLGAASTN